MNCCRSGLGNVSVNRLARDDLEVCFTDSDDGRSQKSAPERRNVGELIQSCFCTGFSQR